METRRRAEIHRRRQKIRGRGASRPHWDSIFDVTVFARLWSRRLSLAWRRPSGLKLAPSRCSNAPV